VAAVLTLGVLAGSAEHVVTGVALLAFGLGWGLLAALTTRLTTSPQRWALVPAAVMSVTGLGLLTLQPGTDALTAAGWVWPPALLVLVAWTQRRMRAAMPGRTRWLLYPVLGALALASVGGLVEAVALERDTTGRAMPGELVDVGGHRLHLSCAGTGSPTVVLENGLGETSPWWARVMPEVAETTRVCAYDRAGQGWSDDVPTDPDALTVAADLRDLLDAAGEDGPFVLAGHSSGGAYAMTFAAENPGDVAGMVLLDSSTPDQATALPDFAGEHAAMKRVLGVLPSLARLGVGRLAAPLTSSDLPEPAAAQAAAFAASSRGLATMRDEHAQLPAAFRQAGALTSLGDKPLVVLTATENLRGSVGWGAAQDRLAVLSTNADHRVVEASHVGLLDDPADAASSAAAITDVVRSVRTGTPLTTH
jgi:pimeloyl-ACP methyl ester carboxylesterase